METLTVISILKLLNVETQAPWYTFEKMQKQGLLDKFPKPLKTDFRKKRVFDKAKVLKWIEKNYQPPTNLIFEFLKGSYAPPTLQTKWTLRKQQAKLRKPKTVLMKCIGDW